MDRRRSPTVARTVTAGVAASLVALAAVALAVALAVLIVAPVTPARAAPLRDCTRTHGTIVAVDFGHWGGPVVRGCGVGERTGYALLRAAGFTTAGDAHDGPAFICRLGDSAFHGGRQYPTPQQQACVVTPPDSAHWSYWLAPAGTNYWSYSELGAMSEIPRTGEVELWTFGATNSTGTKGSAVPALRPAALRRPVPSDTSDPHTTTTHATTTTRTTANRTTTTQTTTRTTRTRARAAGPSHTRGAGHTTTAAHTTTSATTATSTTATRTSTRAAAGAPTHAASTDTTSTRVAAAAPRHGASTTTTAARTTTTARATDPSTTPATHHAASRERVVAARPTTQHASSGSATPMIIAAALVALLVAGALRTLRARRRQE